MNNLRTFIFNNVNVLEAYDVFIDSVQKSSPEKVEHVKSLPYVNGEFNFDKIFGRPTFRTGTIVYTCQIIEGSSRAVDDIVTALQNLLMQPVEAVLQDTGTPTYHYIAECKSVVPAMDNDYAELTITFKTYPFKIKNASVGLVEWDHVNFDLDFFQQTEFSFEGSTTISVNNCSACPVAFTYSTSATIQLKVDGQTYELSGSGTSPFLLLPGVNTFEVSTSASGSVSLSFDWIEELI